MLGHWVTRPEPFRGEKGLFNESDVTGDTFRQVIHVYITCRAAATGRLEIEEEAKEQKKKKCRAVLVTQRVSIHPVMSCLEEWPLYGIYGDIVSYGTTSSLLFK